MAQAPFVPPRFTRENGWYVPAMLQPEQVDYYRQHVYMARAPRKTITVQAEERARGLLESMLNPTQLATLHNNYYIDARGSAGGQFRVFTHCGVSHNVYNVTNPGMVTTTCYHLRGTHPTSDHILGQLMIIRTDELSLAYYPTMFLGDMYGWLGHVSPTLLPPYTPWNPGVARTA